MEQVKYNTPVMLSNSNQDSHHVKPLPEPTGLYPYHLDLEQVIPDKALLSQNDLYFQMVGDTGSVRHSDFQATVARCLQTQVNEDGEQAPSFLYHLGDIVYNHGEAHEYPAQFLEPYKNYPAPIFAIAGNHDGDINPNSSSPYQSLDAFMDVFCDTESRPIGFNSDRNSRKSMIQPHVYWTLETPLARFIGLYANVTKHGFIDDEQRNWFVEELRDAANQFADQALIVCVHHAPYSADSNHGSSLPIIHLLEGAFAEAGVRPDAVFSGHVHNYQRFHKTYADGMVVPYIVAGAGGYADLHELASLDNREVQALPAAYGQVQLMASCDVHYGFLKIGIHRCAAGLKLSGKYYSLSEPKDRIAKVYDQFDFLIKRPLLVEA